MPKSKQPILNILFPEVRAQLLRLLFRPPQHQRYVRELMSMSGLALHTVQDELRKLTAIGVLTTWTNGYHRFYRANRRHSLFNHLRGIVEISAQLPGTKQSVFRRRRTRFPSKKSTTKRASSFPINRPPNWGLFSGKAKTRRL
jgi:predicted transcriptional regulator